MLKPRKSRYNVISPIHRAIGFRKRLLIVYKLVNPGLIMPVLEFHQAKNLQIKKTVQNTKARRKNMLCRTYELKILKRKLSTAAFNHLTLLFLEAKWYSNAIIGNDDIFEFDSKTKSVMVMCPDGAEFRLLHSLSSQMKQSLLKQIQQDVISLSKKKDKGLKVGALKFKKCVQTIPLKQHGNTYTIRRPNRIRIQGLRRWLKLRGMAQIPMDAEFANANLQYKNGDFYLLVTCYLPKTPERRKNVSKRSIGVDGGIAHQFTLSNGIQLDYEIPITKQIRKLYRRLARRSYGSKNYVKTLQQLRRHFKKWNNQKNDTINQIVHLLTYHYQLIAFQTDPHKAWQRIWGRRSLNTALGKLFTTLTKRAVIPIPIDQWEPTTKRCSACGTNLPKAVPLTQRIFICSNPKCCIRLDRDLNGSTTMEKLGTGEFEPINTEILLPLERWESMPPEANTAIQELRNRFDRLPFVSAQVLPAKEEAPSFLAESARDPLGSRAG